MVASLGGMNIADDTKPSAWLGHVVQTVTDPTRTIEFYERLGLRTVMVRDTFAITELRGGTHIVFQAGEITPGEGAPFDLMVEDLDETHRVWSEAGAEVSGITPGDVHSTFVLVDPDGVEITVSDSHVIGAV